MNPTINKDRDFLGYLQTLGEQTDPQVGFFGPASLVWRISREPVLLLFGMRALLLQIAHPYVAQAVADHSRYQNDPLGRGIRTFKAVYGVVFGSRETAINTALAVHRVHDRVFGVVHATLPPGMNPHYSANDPDAVFWVAATLLDSSIVAYESCIGPLSDAEKEQYYQESKIFGQLFGAPSSLYPATWSDFRSWMQQAVRSEQITVIPAAKDIFRGLLYGTWFTRLLAPMSYAVAVMSLPPKLVYQFGLKNTLWTRITYRVLLVLANTVMRVIPHKYRGVPAARRGEQRLKRLRLT